jgi:TolA-binding protein
MPTKRISKKHLKEDAFVSATFEVGHFLRENQTRLLLGAGGLFVTVFLVWFYFNYRTDRQQEASLALFKAEAVFMNGDFAVAAADFDKVTQDFSGTRPGEKAIFFAGDSYFKAGQYEQALSRFDDCRKELPQSDPLMVNCIVGQGAVQEQLGNRDKAIEFYNEALKRSKYEYQKVSIMTDLARALTAAGKDQEAIAVMDSLVARYPDNPQTQQVAETLAELKARAAAKGKS